MTLEGNFASCVAMFEVWARGFLVQMGALRIHVRQINLLDGECSAVHDPDRIGYRPAILHAFSRIGTGAR